MKNTGVKAAGIIAPFVREGDDIIKIATDAILEATEDGKEIKDKDVYGITESVVARSAGLYVTVDDIAIWVIKRFGPAAELIIDSPIYSRNRFSMILKGIARAAKKIFFVMPSLDEVGNPSGVNPFTGVDIQKYYKEICDGENCISVFGESLYDVTNNIGDYDINNYGWIYCGLHDYKEWKKKHFGKIATLADICSDKNPDFGLLGCNKSTEERIKLFPTKKLAADVCTGVRIAIKEKTGKNVIVMIYGDGAYKDLDARIWELADPKSFLSDEYGDEILNKTPNEVKLKALIDSSESDEEVQNILAVNKGKDLKGSMSSMGTTPRRFGNLLSSLMDLISGSGSRATPIVRVSEYF